MRMVIDTGVLWRPDALRALAELPYDRILPAVALAERARQVVAARRSREELLDLLQSAGILVEPLSEAHAGRYAPYITDDSDWARLARDALIAAHLEPEDILWTTDPDDFVEIGVPTRSIVAVG